MIKPLSDHEIRPFARKLSLSERVILRDASEASQLPLVEGKNGVAYYLIINLLSLFGSLALSGVGRESPNGRSVVVRINDRGPFVGGRIIDLSKAAAASIGMIDAGTAKVQGDHRHRRQCTRRSGSSHCQSQGRCLYDCQG